MEILHIGPSRWGGGGGDAEFPESSLTRGPSQGQTGWIWGSASHAQRKFLFSLTMQPYLKFDRAPRRWFHGISASPVPPPLISKTLYPRVHRSNRRPRTYDKIPTAGWGMVNGFRIKVWLVQEPALNRVYGCWSCSKCTTFQKPLSLFFCLSRDQLFRFCFVREIVVQVHVFVSVFKKEQL